MKKAIKWLNENNIDFTYHDYRKDGLTKEQLTHWIDDVGYEALINKRGTTWRKLTDEQKETINPKNARLLMLENEAMIKRPLLIHQQKITLGFKPELYQSLFE